MAIDQQKLSQFMEKMIAEMSACASIAPVVLGDRLGLYKALAGGGPQTPAELAGRTGTFERYVREWLSAQAAAGYVDYDETSGKFSMTPEQAFVFADETSPAFAPGFYEVLASTVRDEPGIAEAFRTGKGVGWNEHDVCLFRGTERFFRPGYTTNLVSSWIPALDGVREKLEQGSKVADIGCGHGASTVVMAKAFPRSEFVGFDYHEPSIIRARAVATEEGVADRVRFERATAKEYPGSYDLVAFFDCLHDMGDPVGASKHVRDSLQPGGTWMLVEPFANDLLKDNLNPVGRMFYSASTMICTPASRAQEVGLMLGAQAGLKRLREVLAEGGFTRVRLAAQTPFNLVIEARP